MPLPLALLALVAGAGVAVAASAARSSSTRRGPTLEEPATGLDEIDKVIGRADNFAKLLAEVRTSPESADFAAMAKVANDAKAQAETDVKRAIDKTIDSYAAGAATAAAATGVGVVAIPIIYFGAWAGKWAARAQLTLMKWIFGGGADGWSEDWLRNTEGEIKWLSDRGIPFPPFLRRGYHVSPMGYVNGGGGEKCGQGGLCGLRRNFQPAATTDAEGKSPEHQGSQDPTIAAQAVAAMTLVRKHLDKNPFAFALYVTGQAFTGDWTYGAKTSDALKVDADRQLAILQSGDVTKANAEYLEGVGPAPSWYSENANAFPWDHLVVARIRFWHMLVAAIATSVAQERGVTMALWQDMIAKAWDGWNQGIAENAKWAPTRPQFGWWAPGSAAPWGIAFAYMQAQALADYIVNKVKGGATLRTFDPGVVRLIKR